MGDERLEARLREIGDRLDAPAPDLGPAVRRSIRRGAHEPPRASGGRRLAATIAAAAVFVLSGVAVASFLIPGVRVDRVPSAPTASAPGEVDRLGLGEPVTLREARRTVDINVLLPQRLGRPDAIYVAPEPAGGRVTLVYRPGADLPEDPNTGAGMLVTMFRGRTEEAFVRKQAGPETRVRGVTVDEASGLWIEGAPHTVVYTDRRGDEFLEDLRLAGNVLIWQSGTVTLRLESRLPLGPSLEVARSMA